MVNTSTEYMGLKLKSPFIAASSGLTVQEDVVVALEANGIGAIVLKSLFEEQINNEALFLSTQCEEYPESMDYLNHYIRQNSVDKYITNIKRIKSLINIPVIASINCFSKGEWTSYAKEIEAAGADGLELNFYSLPLSIEKSSNEIEQDYFNIVKSVSESINIPVAVKIASTFTNIPAFVNGLKAYGAKAVVMFNRFYTPDIDIDSMTITGSEPLSHPEEYLKELRWIAITSSLVQNFDISATTGIHTPKAAIKEILAGATTVQLCTALYRQGATSVAQFVSELETFISKNGFSSVSDFKGKLNYSSIENPAQFERVQFMKTFGSK